MSQILQALNGLPTEHVLLAEDGGIVPSFTPALPDALKGITGKVLAWAAGIGIALAVLGQVLGWSMIGIGHSTERSNLASRGKQSVIWSLVGGMGLAVASSLVMLFYNAAKGGA
ncbi:MULTISPECIES: hypothetical protein [unclassified Streptomyces]|uniref:hypothetical protein n=1 Tax=unclassified Streptomyces TaxID=2593676 RepID=UPI0033A9254B